jgi:hypothetical protein
VAVSTAIVFIKSVSKLKQSLKKETEILLALEACAVGIMFNCALQLFKAYCAICVRGSDFRHQASPRMSPRENIQRRKVELWARDVR